MLTTTNRSVHYLFTLLERWLIACFVMTLIGIGSLVSVQFALVVIRAVGFCFGSRGIDETMRFFC